MRRAGVRDAALLVLMAAMAVATVATTRPVGSLPAVALGLAVVAFAAGRLSGHRYAVQGVLVAVVGWGLMRALVSTALGDEPWSGMAEAIIALTFGAFPWLTGRYLRQRAELLVSGWERVASLERERDAVAEQERLRERTRIAEEMHDSLGHSLSLIAVRAGALEVAPGLTAEEYREGAGELRARASEAIGRLHEVIGLLERSRAEGSADDGLAGLVDRACSAGMDIDWDGTEPEGDGPACMLAHAVVREALTNAAKHAPGARVAVEVSALERKRVLSVRVRNGPSAPGGPASPSGGRGLRSLRERVEQVGGALRAGPGADGFAVEARLPATAAAAATGARGRPDRARRELIGAGAVVVSVLVPLVAGWYIFGDHVVAEAVLAPDRFGRLEIGQEQADAERLLPSTALPAEVSVPEAERVLPAVAEGECRFYGSETGRAWSPDSAYRVCFSGGEVVSACVYERRPAPSEPRCKEDGDT
ncbi:sensor histidine kinase [Nocardiopsis baichengensis]|uniref:sensor histidine kinase n=1 Tax=Nocardiopsis baichengensis TaxID=280240 RepID=UPI001EF9ECEE|nr:histidine kinase [Nocardiopsis baichengensis]